MELASSHRNLVGNSVLVSFTLGEILIALFAYISRHWLILKWLITAYNGLTLIYLYFIPESPYWLYNRKKFDELEKLLGRIARLNRYADNRWLTSYRKLVSHSKVEVAVEEGRKKKITKARYIFLCIGSLIAFITMLLYIKVSYGLARMNDAINPYLNIVIGAIVEAIGYLTANYLMETKLGRKYALIIYACLTSTCVFVSPFIHDRFPIPTVIVSQLGKLTISGCLAVSWMYVPELFPTSMRGLSNALFILFGRFGAILAPLTDALIDERYAKITFYVYASITLIMIGLVLLLPETRNRPLDDESQEPTTNVDQSEDAEKRKVFNVT